MCPIVLLSAFFYKFIESIFEVYIRSIFWFNFIINYGINPCIERIFYLFWCRSDILNFKFLKNTLHF